jgi:curved DNA-binding protein CbpA
MIQVADPYHLLQVIPDAEPEVIQAAYRALARKYHPDMGGTDLQMAQLNAAWETLRDRGGRELFDRERKESAAAQTTPTQRGAVEDPPVATVVPLRSRSPRGRPGTVLDFGRYAGLSLGDLAIEDPDYLVWLARTPIGHRLQLEIDTLMAARRPIASRSERPKSRFARSR